MSYSMPLEQLMHVVRPAFFLAQEAIVLAGEEMPPNSVTWVPSESVVLFWAARMMELGGPCIAMEFAGGLGYSTRVLGRALSRQSRLVTAEYDERRYETLSQTRPEAEFRIIKGDIRDNLSAAPRVIDLLVIDEEHSGHCAKWTMANLIPRVRNGGCIVIHDMETVNAGEMDYFAANLPSHWPKWDTRTSPPSIPMTWKDIPNSQDYSRRSGVGSTVWVILKQEET